MVLNIRSSTPFTSSWMGSSRSAAVTRPADARDPVGHIHGSRQQRDRRLVVFGVIQFPFGPRHQVPRDFVPVDDGARRADEKSAAGSWRAP